MAATNSPKPPGIMNRIASFAYSSIDSSLGSVSYLAEKMDRIGSTNKGSTSKDQHHSAVSRTIEELRAQIKRGAPISIDSQTIAAILNASLASGKIDDRLMLLEDELVLLSRLPPDLSTTHKLRHKTNTILWNDLAHPPSTFVGPEHQFRSADGSGTSIWFPEMGKALSPYARSVTSTHAIPPDQLPDPGLVFDALLKREKPVNHPAGLSSFFFAFANLVIHEIFNTDNTPGKTKGWNKTSSYVDLSIIYGNNIKEQMEVRVQDGTGRIHNDTFADRRLLKMAPATPALLVLFCRNHNWIAERLLDINERRRWTKNISSLNKDDKDKQDNEIFQTTRLIMCGFFISIVLGDYLSGILGLVRDGNSWSLDILEEFRDAEHKLMPRGEGNHLSTEFVALYHWHATVSQADERWFEGRLENKLGHKSWDQVTPQDLWRVATQDEDLLNKDKDLPNKDKDPSNKDKDLPNKRCIPGFVRDPVTGSYSDDDLANALQKAILEPANAFGARSTPHVMRVVEIMGIEQNRAWGTCSLNEFRKFLGLKTFETFGEWNSNPEVSQAAERLYKHPDNLELYVGLQAEDAKPLIPGAGLLPGYTVSRAILADAIALTRGDRFLTTDFTPFNLTSWGFNECKRNPDNSSFGGMLGRVLTRALPNHFPADSVFTCFPMITPNKMQEFLSTPGVDRDGLYTYGRPGKKNAIKAIKKRGEVKDALASPYLHASYPSNAQLVLPGEGYLKSFNDKIKNEDDRKLIAGAFIRADDITEHCKALRDITVQLLETKSYTFSADSKRSVDIVGDVINLIPIQFAANNIFGLMLKTDVQPDGLYFEQELRSMLADIYEFILMDQLEPSVHTNKQILVKEHCEQLHRQVDRNIDSATSRFSVANLGNFIIGAAVGRKPVIPEVLRRLVESKKPSEELANNAIALGTILAMELGQALTHVVDTLLQRNLSSSISELTQSRDPKSSPELKAYISESLRLQPAIGGVYRDVPSNVKLSDGTNFVKGDRFFISIRDANLDDIADPGIIKANRKSGSTMYGDGIVRLLGEAWLLEAIEAVVKVIFSLKGLERAQGNSGILRSIERPLHDTKQRVYLDERQFDSPWASSLTVTYQK